jgi:energy-coupling factor transport system ATP-binding protein
VDLAFGVEQGRVRSGSPAEVIRSLAVGPPVAELGRALGWDPLPLTVRDARDVVRTMAVPSRPVLATRETPGEVLAEVRGLDLSYDRTPALRGVDLDLRAGEVVALMGRNGAGKSSLLRVIAGVQHADAGLVHTNGHGPRPGVDVALCPQESDSVLFSDSVALEIRATLAARDASDVEPWLDALDITELAAVHPRDLSAGQRLLVATAAIAATGAPILLLDEPTRGLDPAAKGRLTRFVRAHAASGGAVVVATHDVELAAGVASRVVMLAAGEVIADGDPAVVLGDSRVFAPQMTRVFGPGWLTPEQVVEALA